MIVLQCPNAPEDTSGLLYARDKHENFTQHVRYLVTERLLPNGQVWGFHDTFATRRERQSVGPITCETCGAEAYEITRNARP